MLNVNKLYKYYGINSGNLGISFTLDEGKIFVVYGPKDSGKTLLLKQLANIIEPDVGDIKIQDHSYKEIKNFNDNISTYFYTDDFWSRMKIKDYLSLLIKERKENPKFIFKKEKRHHNDSEEDLDLPTEKTNKKTKPNKKMTKEEKQAFIKAQQLAKKEQKKEKEANKKKIIEEKKLKQLEAKHKKQKQTKSNKTKSKNNSNEVYVKKILDFFNINPKMMICNISPEQRRILLLTASIMNKEKLIIIDDFGVDMNEDSRNFFKERFKELAKEGHTVIIATKHKDSLNDIASKIMYIDKGKVLDILSRG